MGGFIRVHWIDIDAEKQRDTVTKSQKEGNEFTLQVCIKEYENGAHIQRKKTILLEFRKSFDSHPRPDRMAQFIIAQGPAQTVIGTTSILITALSKATNGTSNIIKLPFKATPLGTRNEVEYFIKEWLCNVHRVFLFFTSGQSLTWPWQPVYKRQADGQVFHS